MHHPMRAAEGQGANPAVVALGVVPSEEPLAPCERVLDRVEAGWVFGAELYGYELGFRVTTIAADLRATVRFGAR